MPKHADTSPLMSLRPMKLVALAIVAGGSILAAASPSATVTEAKPAVHTHTVEDRLREAFLPALDPQYSSESDMLASYLTSGTAEIEKFAISAANTKKATVEALEAEKQAAAAAEVARIAAEQEAIRIAEEEAARIAAEAEAARIAEEKRVADEETARVAEAERLKKAASRSAERTDPSGSKAIAAQMVTERGWSASEFTCLESLWQKESGWNHTAENRSSGAYGIPQSLPGNKMASAGEDWQTNPATQIKWGLGYIADRYGSPCNAWQASQAKGWY